MYLQYIINEDEKLHLNYILYKLIIIISFIIEFYQNIICDFVKLSLILEF